MRRPRAGTRRPSRPFKPAWSRPAGGVVLRKSREGDRRPAEDRLDVRGDGRAEPLADEPVEADQPFGALRWKTGSFDCRSGGVLADRDVADRPARRLGDGPGDLGMVESLAT